MQNDVSFTENRCDFFFRPPMVRMRTQESNRDSSFAFGLRRVKSDGTSRGINSHPLGIGTGQQCGARSRTQGAGRIEAGEFPPFFRHSINVRCLYIGGSKYTQVLIALIISKDDDEIGRFRWRRVGRCHRRDQAQADDGNYHFCNRTSPPQRNSVAGKLTIAHPNLHV